ncbi:MAG TPA: glucose-1-phosphate thymidylyltransferase RfbA [Candidatus Butyricicoccus stercorigallinarum]|nr:glucose-1-phosphate thymidylyltransferase RfbA [Candidatus Butyricicoccus stercorigallinarum]
MKGLILAAGKGTRLYPMTKPVCKPLLPVYDKPLVYYPLSVLIQTGITDIMVIIPDGEEETFERLLGDGSAWGIRISYAVQKVPRGIADAFLVAEDFIRGESVCLVLGDNIFYDETKEYQFAQAARVNDGATVFGYYVEDPRAFGVVEFDENGNAISIEEKPRFPKSNYIIPGLYFYNADVLDIARSLKPSARGELEITDVNLEYLRRGQLKVIPLNDSFVWKDAGTADNLLEAANCVREVQERTGRYIACPEECAYDKGLITQEQVHAVGVQLGKTLYGQYLQCL